MFGRLVLCHLKFIGYKAVTQPQHTHLDMEWIRDIWFQYNLDRSLMHPSHTCQSKDRRL
jgi:hypothetical protein